MLHSASAWKPATQISALNLDGVCGSHRCTGPCRGDLLQQVAAWGGGALCPAAAGCSPPEAAWWHLPSIPGKSINLSCYTLLPRSLCEAWIPHGQRTSRLISHHDTSSQVFPLQEPAFRWADNHPYAPDVRWGILPYCSMLTGSCSQPQCMTAAWPLCRIFSSERGPDGKRCFIATTLEGFWTRYRDMLPQHRHCYEIIRHGYPCHLYFGTATCCALCTPMWRRHPHHARVRARLCSVTDLEYRKEFNANVDGDALVAIVLKLCAKGLKVGLQLQ